MALCPAGSRALPAQKIGIRRPNCRATDTIRARTAAGICDAKPHGLVVVDLPHLQAQIAQGARLCAASRFKQEPHRPNRLKAKPCRRYAAGVPARQGLPSL
jgi:hypothetical protein